ncbi:MAG: DUF4876 domain-containing protein [Bacteroidales bacterium]|nr:DUF4876 domain-containing protein [Bacteroidales bacterium]
MRRLTHIIALALILLLSGCRKEDFTQVELRIRLEIPTGSTVKIDLSKVSLRLQSKTFNLSYMLEVSSEGEATAKVQPGKYDLLASYYDSATRIAANGSASEFLLTGSGIVADDGSIGEAIVRIPLNIAVPSSLIIRELYFHGSYTLEGATYQKDRYIELYNNAGPGGETVYLDSLCIAGLYPYNSTTGSNAWAGLDTLALGQMFWCFPGNGHSYPLAPGESCVIAAWAAVDHSQRCTTGLHLEKSHFGCYADHLSKFHEIAAGVTPMICYMAGQGTGWSLSNNSPAFVLFKPDMGVAAYRAHPETWERFEPGKSSGTRYWHIAKNWIIDAVECVDKPEGAVKRLPASVDASYVWMRSPHYSGKCVTRALDYVSEGIEVFKDTNNSENDWIPDSPLSPRLKN